MERLVRGKIVTVDDLPPKTPEQIAAEIRAAIPTTVSKMKAYIYLHRIVRFDEMRDKCYALGMEAGISFDTASEFDRSHPLVQLMELTEEELDTMFLGASAI